jgi:hypothetical protein
MGAAQLPADVPLEDLLGRRQPARSGGRRRGTYRVQSQELQQLGAQLYVDGTCIAVSLLDLSARGAGVHAGRSAVAALEAAAAAGATNRMALRLELPDGVGVRLHAQAVQASAGPDGLRLGLRLAPAEREALESHLLPLFNQRWALRVTPSPRHPVAVQISDPQGERIADAHMVDVSVEGMGLSLDADAARSLLRGDNVGLRFVVAGSREPVRLGAIIRHLRPGPDGTALVGVSFDPEPPDARHARTRVGAYIVRRQLELRRHG